MQHSSAWIWVKSRWSGGHIRNASTLGKSLTDQGIETTVFTDPETVQKASNFYYEGMKFQLLPMLKEPPKGVDTNDDDRKSHEVINPINEHGRIAMLKRAYDRNPPSAIMFELWPTGRRSHDNEILQLIDHVKKSPYDTKLYTMARFVPGSKIEGAAEILADNNIDVLYFGDEKLNTFENGVPDITKYKNVKIHNVGFMVEKEIPKNGELPDDKKKVIVSVGRSFNTGEEARFKEAMLTAAIRASRYSKELSNNPWEILITDDCSPEAKERIEQVAKEEGGDNVIIKDAYKSEEYDVALGSAKALISLGGVSIFEAANAGIPVIVNPIEVLPPNFDGKEMQKKDADTFFLSSNSESEQMLNAKALEKNKLAVTVTHESFHDPEAYASIIDQNVRERESLGQNAEQLNFNGAENAAALISKEITPLSLDNLKLKTAKLEKLLSTQTKIEGATR